MLHAHHFYTITVSPRADAQTDTGIFKYMPLYCIVMHYIVLRDLTCIVDVGPSRQTRQGVLTSSATQSIMH